MEFQELSVPDSLEIFGEGLQALSIIGIPNTTEKTEKTHLSPEPEYGK